MSLLRCGSGSLDFGTIRGLRITPQTVDVVEFAAGAHPPQQPPGDIVDHASHREPIPTRPALTIWSCDCGELNLLAAEIAHHFQRLSGRSADHDHYFGTVGVFGTTTDGSLCSVPPGVGVMLLGKGIPGWTRDSVGALGKPPICC